MFKKVAAFGLSAALVLSPLAAFAQTDTTTPAASRRRRRVRHDGQADEGEIHQAQEAHEQQHENEDTRCASPGRAAMS